MINQNSFCDPLPNGIQLDMPLEQAVKEACQLELNGWQ
jgi:hypothetical protein